MLKLNMLWECLNLSERLAVKCNIFCLSSLYYMALTIVDDLDV